MTLSCQVFAEAWRAAGGRSRRTEPTRRDARESRMTLRGPQPIRRLIRCEPRSPSPSIDSPTHPPNPRVLGHLHVGPAACHDPIRCRTDDYAAAAQCNLVMSWARVRQPLISYEMKAVSNQEYKEFRGALDRAIWFFKLAFGLTATRLDVNYLSQFAFGPHRAEGAELSLTSEQEEVAFSLLEYCATYVAVLQVHSVLERIYEDPFKIPEPDIQAAFQIARLIRNAFSHNPFLPVWQFGEQYENKQYIVPGVVSLSTTGLRGQFLEREHRGGPLAVLRLLEFTIGVLNLRYRGAG